MATLDGGMGRAPSLLWFIFEHQGHHQQCGPAVELQQEQQMWRRKSKPFWRIIWVRNMNE